MKKQDLINLMKAKIINAREMEDYLSKKGQFERVQVWRRKRWTYEEFLEILTSKEKFKEEMAVYRYEINKVIMEAL